MTTTIKTGLAAILLLALSCKKEDIKNSISSQGTYNSVAAHYIGQHYGGGIIFYIDTAGQHGLIADTADLPPSKWWNGVYTITGATGTGIGSGKSNTRKINLSQGDSGRYAARRCWHYTVSGYRDWFLPSKDELNELYKQKKVVGGFGKRYYWSSSEISYDYAWVQVFGNGTQTSAFKYYPRHVRAVRAF